MRWLVQVGHTRTHCCWCLATMAKCGSVVSPRQCRPASMRNRSIAFVHVSGRNSCSLLIHCRWKGSFASISWALELTQTLGGDHGGGSPDEVESALLAVDLRKLQTLKRQRAGGARQQMRPRYPTPVMPQVRSTCCSEHEHSSGTVALHTLIETLQTLCP